MSEISKYHMRVRRVRIWQLLPENGQKIRKTIRKAYRTAPACNCCSLAGAKYRHWQKYLSKQITLRTHRIGA